MGALPIGELPAVMPLPPAVISRGSFDRPTPLRASRYVAPAAQDDNREKISVAFVPPKPNEFDMTWVTFCSRASFGT